MQIQRILLNYAAQLLKLNVYRSLGLWKCENLSPVDRMLGTEITL